METPRRGQGHCLFLFFYYSWSSVVQYSEWEKKEKQHGKMDQPFFFNFHADELTVLNTFFDGTFAGLGR